MGVRLRLIQRPQSPEDSVSMAYVAVEDVSLLSVQACYLRGLNSTRIADDRCRTWLGEWLQISCSLNGEASPGCAADV